MNDPHVEQLRYAVRMEHPRARMADDAALEGVELGPFQCQISQERTLIAVAQQHFASEDEARAVLEPHLRAWESYADLTVDFRLRFTFQAAKVVDRNPSAGQLAAGGKALKLRWDPKAPTLIVRDWPPVPPAGLRETDEVRWLRMRWLAAVDGKEDVLATAGWVLTRLVQSYGEGARKKAAFTLFVDCQVLDQIGELSVVDGPVHGHETGGEARGITPDEMVWLKKAVPRLILRAAEVESLPPPLPTLRADGLEGGSLWVHLATEKGLRSE
jgi:hypothetical protein